MNGFFKRDSGDGYVSVHGFNPGLHPVKAFFIGGSEDPVFIMKERDSVDERM